MTDEQLLAELDDILRTMPAEAQVTHDTAAVNEWRGRLKAALWDWDPLRSAVLSTAIGKIDSHGGYAVNQGYREIASLVHEARHALRLKGTTATSVAVSASLVFDYFDELRKIIGTAQTDILFVDPYLEAEFVSRYLPQVKEGVLIRLLTDKHLPALLPSVELFASQSNSTVQVRTSPGLHDRFVLIDGVTCYQSGASFKDGARKSTTTLTQIIDAFTPLKASYEALWSAAKVER